jgi:hypothetical protein
MATIYEVRDFSDIVAAVREELKVQSDDTTSVNRIKRMVNMAYRDALGRKKWKFLRKFINLYHEAVLETGTADVTNGSATVTLSSAPARSRKGEMFRVDGWPEVYEIAQHTAASATVTLSSPFLGTTNSTASYMIWSEQLPLPPSCADVIEVFHNHMSQPMDGVGLREFRRLQLANPYESSYPRAFTINDTSDPAEYEAVSGMSAVSTVASAGLVKTFVFAASVAAYLAEGDQIEVSGASHFSYNGRFTVSSVSTTTITFTGTTAYQQSPTASTPTVTKRGTELNTEKVKNLLIHPSIYDDAVTLNIDYIEEPQPMSNDSDEPAIPYTYRQVIVHGALHLAWSSIGRNPTEAERNRQLFEKMISQMEGKYDESTDLPQLVASRTYLARKRNNASRRNWLKD